jgi:hypothetical protein
MSRPNALPAPRFMTLAIAIFAALFPEVHIGILFVFKVAIATRTRHSIPGRPQNSWFTVPVPSYAYRSSGLVHLSSFAP